MGAGLVRGVRGWTTGTLGMEPGFPTIAGDGAGDGADESGLYGSVENSVGPRA